MTYWFHAGGVMMWPILGAAVLVLGATVDEGRKLLSGARDAEIGVVLAWGGLAAVFGVLGTLVGIAQMANVLEHVPTGTRILPAFLSGGIKLTLITSIFGFAVFGLSLLLWFGLRALRSRGSWREAAGGTPA